MHPAIMTLAFGATGLCALIRSKMGVAGGVMIGGHRLDCAKAEGILLDAAPKIRKKAVLRAGPGALQAVLGQATARAEPGTRALR